ncbi:hypothetical protein HMPREF0731_2134, partial [Pseudoroseomonas cervicalis ATCC 49957]
AEAAPEGAGSPGIGSSPKYHAPPAPPPISSSKATAASSSSLPRPPLEAVFAGAGLPPPAPSLTPATPSWNGAGVRAVLLTGP